MNLREVANALNIPAYPEVFNTIPYDESVNVFTDSQWLQNLEQTYNLLGHYFPLVLEAAEALKNDSNRLAWGNIISQYLTGCSVTEARLIPMPPRDGSLAGDFLPLFILLTQLQSCVDEYRRRNMPEDMIRRNLAHFKDGISIVETRSGTPAIDQTYFSWLVKFIKCVLFNCHGFNFEVRKLPANVYVLQNQNSGALYPVLNNTLIHRSGKVLGSAGCTDADGSFATVFTETDTHYTAFPCTDGVVCPIQQHFSKQQYKLLLQPGDPIISVHIPRGTNISRSNAATCLYRGFCDAGKYYPEIRFKALYCHSWLLDPNLADLLNPTANIPQFGSIFTRFPAKSAGGEVFSFVFQRKMPLQELPENTSLERALKDHYLNNNFIHAYSGIVLPESLQKESST